MYLSGLDSLEFIKYPILIHYNVDKHMERISEKSINIEEKSIEVKFYSLKTYDKEGRIYVPAGTFMDKIV